MNFERMYFPESGEGEGEDGDPVFSELIDIASGSVDPPDYRGGGSPTPGEFAYDSLRETRMIRGDDAAYELAERIAAALKGKSSHPGEAREVREAALEFLSENDRLPED